jgi:hypothetical protein
LPAKIRVETYSVRKQVRKNQWITAFTDLIDFTDTPVGMLVASSLSGR